MRNRHDDPKGYAAGRKVHRVETATAHWFLNRAERGNPASQVQARGDDPRAWSDGNLVRPLVHGATYFARLYEELTALRAGDRVWFTDWRGDADERLLADGPAIGDALSQLARRGVEVRGLVWRSHGERVSSPISGRSNELLGRQINDAGGEVLLDQRVRLFGSHHQKFFVIRYRDDPSRDIAFVGGLDLSHSRRDDVHHEGDPQALFMDPRYGKRLPWHDLAFELRGPVVSDLLATFAERWDDPHPLDRHTPYRMLLQRLARMPRHPRPLPEAAPPPPPPPVGPHSVQILRTYAACGGHHFRSPLPGSGASPADTRKPSRTLAPSSTSKTSTCGRTRWQERSQRPSNKTPSCR